MWACSDCKKEFSSLKVAYKIDGERYCKICKENESKEENKGLIKEYKRKCQECGKIWHSNLKNEKHLNTTAGLNALAGLSNIFFGNSASTTAQYTRNVNAQSSEITNLKKCPSCGSTNYSEGIIKFKKR